MRKLLTFAIILAMCVDSLVFRPGLPHFPTVRGSSFGSCRTMLQGRVA